MKRIKRAVCLALSAALALGLASCAGPASRKSLYEHGLDVVALMAEMAGSGEYIAMMSGSTEIAAALADAAQGDFSQPERVYRIKIAPAAFSDLAETDLSLLSPELRAYQEARMNAAVIAPFNAMCGTATLAAAGVCSAGKTFVSDELEENLIYLYLFENAVPAAVSFTKGEGGAVSASGTLVFYDGFRGASLSEVEELMGLFEVEVTDVTPQ